MNYILLQYELHKINLHLLPAIALTFAHLSGNEPKRKSILSIFAPRLKLLLQALQAGLSEVKPCRILPLFPPHRPHPSHRSEHRLPRSSCGRCSAPRCSTISKGTWAAMPRVQSRAFCTNTQPSTLTSSTLSRWTSPELSEEQATNATRGSWHRC